VVQWPVGRIVVAFTREPDASLVNDTTVQLLRLGLSGAPDAVADGDAAGAGAELQAIAVALSPANPSVLLIAPRATLEPGEYRVRLRGTGAAALADLNANVLGSDIDIGFTVEAAP